MRINIDSNPRLEIARQRQAGLLQEAERDRLARALAPGIPDPAAGRRRLSRLIGRLRRGPQALPKEAR